MMMIINSPQMRQVSVTHWNCCCSVKDVNLLALLVENLVPSRLLGRSAYCKQILWSFHCYKAADLQPTTGNGSVPPSCSVLEPPVTHTSWLMSHFLFLFPLLYNTKLTVLQTSQMGYTDLKKPTWCSEILVKKSVSLWTGSDLSFLYLVLVTARLKRAAWW